MYVNERDQINYHGFLRALREMNQVSQECVSKGVCTVSGMNRFENGNRVAEKLMRDRLTARLGISGEKYEDYLQPKEYVRWEQRLRIVKAIEDRKFDLAKKELSSYEELPGLNCVNKQYVETMRFMILSLEGAADEVLLECINKALKHTVPNAAKAVAGAHLLCDQEINLIAEQIRLCPPSKVVKDVSVWRMSEYEKLLTYIEHSCWEKLQKAKVYPKIVHNICQILLEKSPTMEECRRGLELCHNAIELLRDTSRLYYFIELTEARRALAEHLISFNVDDSEKAELDKMLHENNEWEKVFKELYTEYKVAPYMSDFCYLYYETECHDMVEVIETRRKMLGLSRVKLADGICTDRTIIRFEREGRNPSIDLVRLLFEKMGLCAEYRRTPIIVADGKALMMYLDLVNKINRLEYKEAEQCIHVLSEEICMNIVYNKQEINRLHNLVLLKNKTITRKNLEECAIDSVQYTLPISAIEHGVRNLTSYLTRSEVECVYDIAFNGEGREAEICNQYIKQRCEKLLIDFPPAMMPIFELLLSRMASELGDKGEYDKSCNISQSILGKSLLYRRTHNISESIYNILWNEIESHPNVTTNNDNILKKIKKCICISRATNEMEWVTFFENKYGQVLG